MKQIKLSLVIIICLFGLTEHNISPTLAQTAEPSYTTEGCYVTEAGIRKVEFSADGQYLLADWPLHSVRVWSVKTGEIVSVLKIDANIIAFSPDSQYIATGGYGSIVSLWDFISGKKVRIFDNHQNKQTNEKALEFIQNFAFSSDGDYIATLDTSTAVVWNVQSGSKVAEFPVTNNGNPDVKFSSDGKTLLVEDRIYDVHSHELLHEVVMGNITHFSPDGKYIVGVEFPSYKFILIDTTSYKTEHTLNAFDGRPNNWEFSPDGKYLLATKTEGLMRIWETETGKLLHEFEAATQYGIRPTFLNNRYILMPNTFESDPERQTIIYIHDIETGHQLYKAVIDVSLYKWAAVATIAPDGKSFAISSIDQSKTIVTAWDIQSGKLIHQYC